MKTTSHSLARLALTAALAFPGFAASLDDSAQRYLDHVRILASQDMKGRGAGSPELERAAGYIAGQFQAIGLEPAGDDGGYFQAFEVTTGAEMGEKNGLTVKNLRGEESYAAGEDYTPINFSASGSVSGNVVFAGYGISSEEHGYDDYFHLDVTDRIVVLLRYEPEHFSTEERRGRRRYTHHANLISKAINARNRGAKAVILVNGQTGEDDRLIKFGSVAGPTDGGIPMIQAHNAVVESWLRRSGKSLKVLQRDIDSSKQPQSASLADNLTLSLDVDVVRKKATINNVAAYLPGETNEYVVFGAHYDHLGLGDESSLAPDSIGEVHHGADDNASGTAGLIEIARRYSQPTAPARRGALFLAFAGEEIGLLGSAHWVENPTRPLEGAAAMLNMDMIGRIDKGKAYIGGVGTAQSFKPLVNQISSETSLEVDFSESGYSASDHTSFTAKGVPVLFFFSGLHGDYHKPSDTWDKINAASAVEMVGMVGDIGANLRTDQVRPKFVKVQPPKHAVGGHGDSAGGGGGYGPYFGSIPDFAQVPNGVRFADVRPGSPADKGGLKGGDILVHFGAKPITNLYDFTYALRESEVGQTVEIKAIRDGKEMEFEVTLEERR